ncbi:MAG TPA: aminodeoxychorismate synthase component I [Planctomycetota bacterium]|nr:aminodeoxychorismate synthase component I [Planctomycetota bacterium]
MRGATTTRTRPLGPGPEPHEVLHRLSGKAGLFLLESALPGGRHARWSHLGAEPSLRLLAKGRRSWLERQPVPTILPNDAFRELGRLLRELAAEPAPPRPPDEPAFRGGLVGYLGYELGRLVERLPGRVPDDLRLPDMNLGLYETVLSFDHERRVWHASAAEFGAGSAAERARRLDAKLAAAAGWLAAPAGGAAVGDDDDLSAAETLRSNFTPGEYEAAVARVIEYIRAGDIFQANLTQRFTARWSRGALGLYLRLRRVNPAPFAAYYDSGRAQIASASPELFLRVDGRRVETRPIKGTRPRSDDPETDRRLAAELLGSPKDRAELTMIVDLERNDLGRVCSYGSVRVEDHLALESFATVHHLVSTVAGELHDGRTLVDLLRATFPGGSITGAPKIRAMQIIDELERSARGVYTGALGCIGLDGFVELNLPIRTFTVADGRAHFGVGGGIVADSSPAGEYQETLDKARGLVAALER